VGIPRTRGWINPVSFFLYFGKIATVTIQCHGDVTVESTCCHQENSWPVFAPRNTGPCCSKGGKRQHCNARVTILDFRACTDLWQFLEITSNEVAHIGNVNYPRALHTEKYALVSFCLARWQSNDWIPVHDICAHRPHWRGCHTSRIALYTRGKRGYTWWGIWGEERSSQIPFPLWGQSIGTTIKCRPSRVRCQWTLDVAGLKFKDGPSEFVHWVWRV